MALGRLKSIHGGSMGRGGLKMLSKNKCASYEMIPEGVSRFNGGGGGLDGGF